MKMWSLSLMTRDPAQLSRERQRQPSSESPSEAVSNTPVISRPGRSKLFFWSIAIHLPDFTSDTGASLAPSSLLRPRHYPGIWIVPHFLTATLNNLHWLYRLSVAMSLIMNGSETWLAIGQSWLLMAALPVTQELAGGSLGSLQPGLGKIFH